MTVTRENRPPTSTEPPEGSATKRNRLAEAALGSRAQGLLSVGVFLALFVFYGVWLGDRFLNLDARLLNVHQNVPILLLALAALVTLLGGLFDLSIASMATLCAFLAIGLRTQQELSFPVVLVICLGVGLLGGLVNGILVEYLKVNTFIATLGTGGVLLGISSVYSNGGPITPLPDSPPIPEWFVNLGAYTSHLPSWVSVAGALVFAAVVWNALRGMRPRSMDARPWLLVTGTAVFLALVIIHVLTPLKLNSWLSHVSWLVAALLIAATCLWILLEFTSFGRSLKASGENPVAARLAGVRTSRYVVGAFMVGGFCSSLAGILLAANTGTVSPNMAGPFLLPAFAAAFLSTVVFSTGQFKVWGSIAGGVFVVWVSQGLIVGGLPATWTDVVNGVVLVTAVAVSTFVRRGRTG